MNFINEIKKLAGSNKGKKIGLFIDMDGVIADYDIDGHIDISRNKRGVFLEKRPLKSVIKVIEEISKLENTTIYILSACIYKNQADDKNKWLDHHAPFIKKENRYFVIKEIVNYNIHTKPMIKVGFIDKIKNNHDLDICIYIEDEHEMLREAQKMYKTSIIRYHVSSLID